MKNFLRIIATASLFALTAADSSPAADGDSVRFFENNIRPLLIENCLKCHGPKKSESGLRLDSKEFLLKGGDSGPAIEPGKSKESLLMKAVRHEDGFEMPPGKKLSRLQVSALATWIDKGAAWPVGMTLAKGGPKLRGGPITEAERAHWAYQPIRDPRPPKVNSSRRVRNDIDRFLQAKLAAADLESSSPASKRILIRRATFDLTGLPPTPEEINAFLKDNSVDAFRKVVDRLLASKAYGERWGRHWLDVVRYADTAGDTADYPTPLSYKYRNWVIDAFNKDKPYDQFIREQVAGDILAAQTDDISEVEYRELMKATGFLAISRRFGFDVENYHHLTIQDTIDTLGQAILGLTLGCARCHDHKYDPVNTDDYYAWYGIFESTRYSFPGSEQKKRPYDSFPALPSAIAAQRKAEHDARLARIDEEIKRLNMLKETLAAKLKNSSGSTVFAGFETQPLGTGLTEPWGTLEDLQVVAAAQSPFENVFLKGSRGLAMPNNAGNNAFGRPLEEKYTAKTTPKIYYNIDFKLTDNLKRGRRSVSLLPWPWTGNFRSCRAVGQRDAALSQERRGGISASRRPETRRVVQPAGHGRSASQDFFRTARFLGKSDGVYRQTVYAELGRHPGPDVRRQVRSSRRRYSRSAPRQPQRAHGAVSACRKVNSEGLSRNRGEPLAVVPRRPSPHDDK